MKFYHVIRRHKPTVLQPSWGLVFPMAVFLSLFMMAPLCQLIAMSLQPYGGEPFGAFTAVIKDGQFWTSWGWTIFIAGISVCVEVALGLVIAVALTLGPAYIRKSRPLWLMPLVIPTSVAAVMGVVMFASGGWVDRLLALFGVKAPDFLTDPSWAWMSVGAVDVWRMTPLVVIILMAGIHTIDRDVICAAQVDGADTAALVRWVIWPLIQPAVGAALLIRGVDAFRIFALPVMLTGRTIPVVSAYVFWEHRVYQRPATAAAASVLLCGTMLAVIILGRRFSRRRNSEAWV